MSGSLLWDKAVHAGVPSSGRHSTSTHANATLATDGTHLVAFFGTEGLYCFRLTDGRLLWERTLGVLDSGYFKDPSFQWGFGSSPIIHEGRIVILCDVQKESFLAALSLKDGTDIWRTPRHDVPTWATPTVFEERGRTQIVTNGWREIAGYDFATGKQLWKMDATARGGDLPIPTPIIGKGLIFITSAHGPAAPVFAIRTAAAGTISLGDGTVTSPHIAWTTESGYQGSYIPTPLLYDDLLYQIKFPNVLRVYEAVTGTVQYQMRIGQGAIWSSPVAADGKIYITDSDGDVFVIKAGGTFQLLAENQLGGPCQSTPAISEGILFFRTRTHLLAIGSKARRDSASGL